MRYAVIIHDLFTSFTGPCEQVWTPAVYIDDTAVKGKGGNVTSVGWQVTLCDPVWHVSSRSGVAG